VKNIAIITARGGSKRIPRKNIKEFMGKPMLAYAIEAAKKSSIFDTVMVSTDDKEIAAVAKKYGAAVPFMRGAKTSSDYAITYDVLEEVLTEYKKLNISFDMVCCIYPCVPFLTADSLQKAYNQMLSDSNDAVMPVCKYPVPIEWAMIISEGKLVPNDCKAQLIRSQDLVPKYYDVGMFYFCKTSALLEHKTLVPPNTGAYIIDETECQDIDTMEDWKAAELKYKILQGV
jgi:hypothetical protein